MPEDLSTPPAESHTPVTETPFPVTLPTEFAAPEALPEVPGYVIVRELGRGGMGVVYLAQQVGLDRLVALKVVLFAEHASSEVRRRFVNEARTVARLSHPNIVQIYDIAEHNGLPYFSLEYCAGGTLACRLAKGPIDPREAAEIVRTLALAVHAAHEKGIIHRDLKPGNILFSAEGTPRVADFGLARRADSGQNTQSGAILGTPAYMAPEQARGKSSEIGPHTDVWALGAILYECLTGRPPFKASSALDTLMLVIEREPERPRQMRNDVPRDLEAICLSCLEKATSRRIKSAKELADNLDMHISGTAIRRRLHPWRRLAVVGGILLSLIGISTGLWQCYRTSADNVALPVERDNEPKVARRGDDHLLNEAVNVLQDNEKGMELGQQLDRIKPREKPNLFGVIVGVSDYSQVRAAGGVGVYDSTLSALEAKAVHSGFQKRGKEFYRDVKLELLVDQAAKCDAILRCLSKLSKQVKKDDRVVLYLSGHGWSSDGTPGSFTFLCADTNTKDGTSGLTSSRLGKAIQALPCHCIVLLDAAHAGAFITAALDPTRHIVFACCGPHQQSLSPSVSKIQEAGIKALKELKYSLFTQLLLQATEDNLADQNRDGVLDSDELFRYINDRMPHLCNRLKLSATEQVPEIFPKASYMGGKNKPLGMLSAAGDDGVLILPR